MNALRLEIITKILVCGCRLIGLRSKQHAKLLDPQCAQAIYVVRNHAAQNKGIDLERTRAIIRFHSSLELPSPLHTRHTPVRRVFFDRH